MVIFSMRQEQNIKWLLSDTDIALKICKTNLSISRAAEFLSL